MGIIQPQRSGSQELAGFYDKVNTNADASRFVGSESGKREILPFSAAEVEDGNYLFTLTTFTYLTGLSQLQLYVRRNFGPINGWVRILDAATAQQDPTFIEGDDLFPYYEEVSSSQVRVKNGGALATAGSPLLFEIPQTSIPAEVREKVVVQDQGDNVAFEGLGNGDGILLRSVGGRKVLAQVDDSRNWVMTYLG